MSADPAHGPEDARPRGLTESVRTLLASGVAIVHTRLALFGAEIDEQLERIASILLWGLISLFGAFLAVVLCALALIVVFWDTHRVAVAVGLAAVFTVLALLAIRGFIVRVRARPTLFSATLDELNRDHERLSR